MEGTCYNCQKTYDQYNMREHFQTCKILKDTQCLVGVESEDYWMVLLCTTNVRLINIDIFLRKVWLECCYHMSQFNQNKNDRLFDLINLDKHEIIYAYDMGSTTEVVLTIFEQKYVLLDDNASSSIILIAQNEKQLYKCEKCKKDAVYMENDGFDKEYRCKKCVPIKRNDMFNLIINSPRSGICGYDGDTQPEKLCLYTENYDNALLDHNDDDDNDDDDDDDDNNDIETNILNYRDMRELKAICITCNKKYSGQYILSHIKKSHFNNKIIIRLEYAAAYLREYNHQWCILECGIKTTVQQLYDFIQETYNLENKKKITKKDNASLVNIKLGAIVHFNNNSKTMKLTKINDYIKNNIHAIMKYIPKETTDTNNNNIKIIAHSETPQKDIDIISTIYPS